MRQSTKQTAFATALAIVVAIAGARSAPAETLGDALREHGWDKIIGWWVGQDAKGAGFKLNYAWKFEDTLIEVTSWQEGKQTVSLMGRNPKSGEVYHFGADSEGGGSLGAWSIEEGDAVLSTMFVTAQGVEGTVRIRHHMENDDTIVVSIEAEPEPVTFKMKRVKGKLDAPKKDVPKKVGPEKGARGTVQKDARGAQREKEGVLAEGATLVYVDTPIRNFDTNENLTIEPEELQKGYVSILKQYDDSYGMLLALFDKDHDGTLGEKESRGVKEFALGLAGMLQCDRNGDWKVAEPESDQAWERLTMECERHNEGSMKRFDKNQDGKLSREETAAAQKMIQQWRTRGRK